MQGQAAKNGTLKFCQQCMVRGCDSCLDNSTTSCAVCSKDYSLNSAGACIYSNVASWTTLLVICCLLALWVSLDLLFAWCMPTTNLRAIVSGLRFRARTKVRDWSSEGQPLYGLWSTTLHTRPIGGPGVPLFFNWFILVAAVCIYLFILSIIFQPTEEEERTVNQGALCAWISADSFGRRSVSALPRLVLPDEALWTGLSYGGVVLMTMVFYVAQRFLWIRMKHDSDTADPLLFRFAMEVSGLPANITTKQLTSFFTSCLEAEGFASTDLVEVSIAYNYTSVIGKVDRLIDQHLDEEEDKLAAVLKDQAQESHSKLSELIAKAQSQNLEEIAPAEVVSSPSFKVRPGSKDPVWAVKQVEEGPASAKDFAGPPWVQLLAWCILGTDMWFCGRRIPGWSPSEAPISKEEGRQLLQQIPCSGSAIVVFQTRLITKALLHKYGPNSKAGSLLLTRGEEVFPLSLRRVPDTPVGVLWQNFGVSWVTHLKRVPVCIIGLLLSLVTWTVLYVPWSSFTWRTLGNTTQTVWLVGLLLGGVVALGNTVVSFTVIFALDYYAFRYTTLRNRLYLLLIVPLMWINCSCDFWVTLTQAAAEKNAQLSADVNYLSAYGLRLIMDKMFELLVPAYNLVPYIGEPMASVLLPYMVAMLRIKRDSRISEKHAERLLAAPPLDIVSPPYCDIVLLPSVFLLTFLAPSRVHWKLFLALLGWVIFLYPQVRLRMLRYQAPTFLATNELHQLESYLWALPVGLLAATFASNVDYRTSTSSKLAGSLAFFGHVLLHWAFVRMVVPRLVPIPERVPVTYSEVRDKFRIMATYRNCNPIEVLRSRLNSHDADEELVEALTFWKAGKEFLQPQAHRNYVDDQPWNLLVEGGHTLLVKAGQSSRQHLGQALAAFGSAMAVPLHLLRRSDKVEDEEDKVPDPVTGKQA